MAGVLAVGAASVARVVTAAVSGFKHMADQLVLNLGLDFILRVQVRRVGHLFKIL